MRLPAHSLQVTRQALLASVIALAVAAPAVLLLDRAINHSPATPGIAPPAKRQATKAAYEPLAKPGRHRPKKVAALPGPGLPGSVVQSLKASPLVVVALYSAGDPVDMAAGAEAEAGAAAAKVPYVAVNVSDESQIGDLASRLSGLTVPSVIVLGRPGRVLAQLDGYADREAVASAVSSARRP